MSGNMAGEFPEGVEHCVNQQPAGYPTLLPQTCGPVMVLPCLNTPVPPGSFVVGVMGPAPQSPWGWASSECHENRQAWTFPECCEIQQPHANHHSIAPGHVQQPAWAPVMPECLGTQDVAMAPECRALELSTHPGQSTPRQRCPRHPRLALASAIPDGVAAPPAALGAAAALHGPAGQRHKAQENKSSVFAGKGKSQVSSPVEPVPISIDQSLGDPLKLAESVELSRMIMEQLDGRNHRRRLAILKWLRPATLDLAFSACGCRVMQKVLEVAGGDDRTSLIAEFHGLVTKLLESPHGNHVLQKFIEVMPPHSVQFMVEELAQYPGSWVAVVRHKFGCRVSERLLEHCSVEMTAPLIAVIMNDAHTLSRHPYANYVVQHVIEYGSQAHRNLIISSLVRGGVPALAQHRVASNVVEHAIEHCCQEGRDTLARAVLSDVFALVSMGCSRYGSYSVRRLLEVLVGPLRDEAVRQLMAGIEQLRASKHGRSLAHRLTRAAAAGGSTGGTSS